MNKVYRLYIGFAIGVLITIIFPAQSISNILEPVVNLIIRSGRYLLVPTILFGIVAGFVNIAEARAKSHPTTPRNQPPKSIAQSKSRKLYLYTFLLLLLTTVLLTVVGGSMILLISLPRLPIIFQEFEKISPLGIEEIFLQVFPQNIFNIFSQSGNFILPLAVAGLIFGFAMRAKLPRDSLIPKATLEISTICNFLLDIYVNLLGVGLVLVSMYFITKMRTISNIDTFYQFIITVSVISAAIVCVLYPLIMVLFRCKIKPLTLIKHILGPAAVSSVSGDTYFASIMVLQTFRKRFSHNRDVPYTLTLLGMLFSKAGSAGIASMVFFMVLQSYTAIEITFLNAVWIMAIISLLAPLASASPRLGVIHILAVTTIIYGNGPENGFLIIVPILPFLAVLSTLLDTLTIMFVGYLFANTIGFSESSSESGSRKRIWTVRRKAIS